MKRRDESVFERFYLIQLASVPKNLPETSSRYIDTFTHYYNDPKKYGNPTMTDVRLWYLHFLSVLFLNWQKQISYNRVQWHSFLQASTVLFIEQYAINGWQKKKVTKPDRGKMRPDCVSACIDHVTYLERQMEEQTGEMTKL